VGRLKLASLVLMSVFYLGAGILHFVLPDFYIDMMPDYLPAHAEAVFVSGVAEILLALALLVPQTRTLAAWGVIALLIAVFPANVHVAVNDVHGWIAWARLPGQALLIAWAWWHTQDAARSETLRSERRGQGDLEQTAV